MIVVIIYKNSVKKESLIKSTDGIIFKHPQLITDNDVKAFISHSEKIISEGIDNYIQAGSLYNVRIYEFDNLIIKLVNKKG